MNKSFRTRKVLLHSVALLLIVCVPLPVLGQTEKGVALFNSLEFKSAEEVLRSTLSNEPENIEAAYYLGMSLLMQGKYTEASDILAKVQASEKNGISEKGRLEIALTHVYLELDKFTEALKNLDKAKKVGANPADIHAFQGAYYLEKNNDAEKALEELEKAIEMDSKNSYAYYYAGQAHMRLGNPSKAVQMLKRFLELAPYAPEAEKAKIIIDALC